MNRNEKFRKAYNNFCRNYHRVMIDDKDRYSVIKKDFLLSVIAEQLCGIADAVCEDKEK